MATFLAGPAEVPFQKWRYFGNVAGGGGSQNQGQFNTNRGKEYWGDGRSAEIGFRQGGYWLVVNILLKSDGPKIKHRSNFRRSSNKQHKPTGETPEATYYLSFYFIKAGAIRQVESYEGRGRVDPPSVGAISLVKWIKYVKAEVWDQPQA